MSGKLNVRFATPKDQSFVTNAIRKLSMLVENMKEPPKVEGIEKTYNEMISNPNNSAILVAEEEGKQVGAAVLTFQHALHLGGKYCYLQELIIEGDKRSSGIGSTLLKKVEEISRAKGLKAIDLTQPPPDSNFHEQRTRFYTKNGFEMHGMSRFKKLENSIKPI